MNDDVGHKDRSADKDKKRYADGFIIAYARGNIVTLIRKASLRAREGNYEIESEGKGKRKRGGRIWRNHFEDPSDWRDNERKN